MSKSAPDIPDCYYSRHLSLRERPRLALGSLGGAGDAFTGVQPHLWSTGRAALPSAP